MWRDVKVLGVGNVVRVFFARALVRGDVDPHCSSPGAREADGSTIVLDNTISFLRSIVYYQYYSFHHIGYPRYDRYLINLLRRLHQYAKNAFCVVVCSFHHIHGVILDIIAIFWNRSRPLGTRMRVK